LTTPKKTAARKLLSRKDVLERVPLSYPTIWKMMRDGKFPRSREIGGKAAWIESELNAWITERPVTKLKGDVAS
jgi:prophage regulatory protein